MTSISENDEQEESRGLSVNRVDTFPLSEVAGDEGIDDTVDVWEDT